MHIGMTDNQDYKNKNDSLCKHQKGYTFKKTLISYKVPVCLNKTVYLFKHKVQRKAFHQTQCL